MFEVFNLDLLLLIRIILLSARSPIQTVDPFSVLYSLVIIVGSLRVVRFFHARFEIFVL